MVDLYNTCLHASWTRWPPVGISHSFMDSRGSLNLLWNEPGHIFILRLANIFCKGEIISVSGSAGHVVSVTATLAPLWCCRRYVNEWAWLCSSEMDVYSWIPELQFHIRFTCHKIFFFWSFATRQKSFLAYCLYKIRWPDLASGFTDAWYR